MRFDVTSLTRPRLLFCSYHSYLDSASGAAHSTRDLIELLAVRGWQCSVLSGPIVDAPLIAPLRPALDFFGPVIRYRDGHVKDSHCTLYHGQLNGVDVHGYLPLDADQKKSIGQTEGDAFLELFESVLGRVQPDILLTYGGQWIVRRMIQRAKQTKAKVVFNLRNASYTGRSLFQGVDAVIVPSEATRQHYQQKLGLSCTAIPGPWNWDRFRCEQRDPKTVTFVNPQVYKGAYWFGRIVHECSQRRPDIRFLLVEGRGRSASLAKSGLPVDNCPQLERMSHTSDPRQFYAKSRLVLVPSLCHDAFPRVAVEAMINGVPVLAMRSGGLPEVLKDAGFLFELPDAFAKPPHEQTPTASDVAPWIHTIESLWDDEALYAAEGDKCRKASEAWRPDVLVPRIEALFRRLMSS